MGERLSLRAIDFYQCHFSSFVGGHCRFTPTCSEYAKIAVSHNKFFRAWYLVVTRFLRCRPPYGGVDYPPGFVQRID